MRLARFILINATLMLVMLGNAEAANINVAAAANFTEPAKIAASFKWKTWHEDLFSFGARDQLCSQITQGAQFHVFLSARGSRPKNQVEHSLPVQEIRFSYAIGKLVLWNSIAKFVNGAKTLKTAGFANLSICNPAPAPDGAAAVQAISVLGLYEAMQPKLVEGATTTQAYQFTETASAELSVAPSQLIVTIGSWRCMIPRELHLPIPAGPVLVLICVDGNTRRASLDFLRRPQAYAVNAREGYVRGEQS
ncbi:molybdate ABC transporter substrate-binding protein [Bradyrhizobium sp. 200]|nr:molybdate ABC transporter substrate-binding protein [Bradyrhizobium sp. 200]MCK1641430.1 molybdate ABC transporter substrate-binding protein [Bradyrhizobium sp. 157]UPJ47928.1 molybdate ABC transporter substrate-binding protein [Bradyrhizobium sp. 200]